MIDHVLFTVSDYERSKRFYQQALEPLGYSLAFELDEDRFAGFGPGGKPAFGIREGGAAGPSHVAFAAPDRATVDAFYAAATEAGGTDNGPPGVRQHYHPTYYAAFVRDLDGHNLEAVCHEPE
jgi:catechol 2,3-dioxygenase-like lactoylglutathione lyase family enzyme